MANNIFKNYIYPIATLSGSIIGVGFLALPHIALQVGSLVMLAYVVAMTALVAYIHVIFGRICLKTPDFKRWPGFVGYYLGLWPRRLVMMLMTLGTFGVLLVYLIIANQFLEGLLSPMFGAAKLPYVLVYFMVASFFVYYGVRFISRLDMLAVLAICAILLAIFVKAFSQFSIANIAMVNSNAALSTFFLPYGALMFSLWGTGLIPEVEEMVRGRKKSLKIIVIISTIISAIIYSAFTLLILGITGSQTTESALPGLASVAGNGIVSIALLMGVITTFIAFIAQGLLLKKVFMYDAGLKHFPAWVFVCFIPLILFLLGFTSFINLISFVGGVLLGIDGILILLMYRKIGGRATIVYPLMLIFILGIMYSILYFV